METLEKFVLNRNYEIDKLYIDTFWSSLANKEWIYLSSDIIKMIGFSDDNKGHARTSCFRSMKAFLTENSEYKEVDLDHIISRLDARGRGDNKRKYYIVHPKAFKKFLLSINTKYSQKIYQYYLTLEEIVFDYTKYQCEFQMQQLAIKDKENMHNLKKLEKIIAIIDQKDQELQAKEQELTIARRKTINVTNRLTNVIALKKEQYVYIATTEPYARLRRFKIGSTINLSKRLSQYNSGRPEGDKYYYAWFFKCCNCTELEKYILSFLFNFRDANNTEMIVLNFRYLQQLMERLCNRHDASTDELNEFVQNIYQQSLAENEETDYIPPAMAIPDERTPSISQNNIELTILPIEELKEKINVKLVEYHVRPVKLPAFRKFLMTFGIGGNERLIWALMKEVCGEIVIMYR